MGCQNLILTGGKKIKFEKALLLFIGGTFLFVGAIELVMAGFFAALMMLAMGAISIKASSKY